MSAGGAVVLSCALWFALWQETLHDWAPVVCDGLADIGWSWRAVILPGLWAQAHARVLCRQTQTINYSVSQKPRLNTHTLKHTTTCTTFSTAETQNHKVAQNGSVTHTYLRDIRPLWTQVHLAFEHTDKSTGFAPPTLLFSFLLSLYSGKLCFCKLNTDLP